MPPPEPGLPPGDNGRYEGRNVTCGALLWRGALGPDTARHIGSEFSRAATPGVLARLSAVDSLNGFGNSRAGTGPPFGIGWASSGVTITTISLFSRVVLLN